MSRLLSLKAASCLHDVAHLLGFKPKALAYILYKKPQQEKYRQFDIPKRTGGLRTISAPCPELKGVQQRLSELLQDCIAEINDVREVKSALSHGFRRKHSIVTNAIVHRNKRYVFNLDLENFFGTINFGRVRGFFIKNRNFELAPDVATVLAQIACHNNALPQGSPCSPVISNLVGHVLDVRLAGLAYRTGCTYSRYADDLTFSTNKRVFPEGVAVCEAADHEWTVGHRLAKIIEGSGFEINHAKTRMQYEGSRQEVTGLVVNSKVNTRVEYRRLVRAMVHQLLTKGKFQVKQVLHLEDKTSTEVAVDGNVNQLGGMLSFINMVGHSRATLGAKKAGALDSAAMTYRNFLIYKNFFAGDGPLLICEGKTDNVYIRCAIRALADDYQALAEKNKAGGVQFSIRFHRYSHISQRILGLGGGTGDLNQFLREYRGRCKKMLKPEKQSPVIFLVDNDEGAKGKGGVFNTVKDLIGEKPDGKAAYYYLGDNLYLVPTPLTSTGEDTMIEDFFDSKVRAMEVGGKKFNPDEKSFNSKTQYGKYIFAEQVIKKHETTIDFSGFHAILARLQSVLIHHSKL